jgi:hypothetical protein
MKSGQPRINENEFSRSTYEKGLKRSPMSATVLWTLGSQITQGYAHSYPESREENIQYTALYLLCISVWQVALKLERVTLRRRSHVRADELCRFLHNIRLTCVS